MNAFPLNKVVGGVCPQALKVTAEALMNVELYRLVLGLGLMFFSGWMIHSALMAARDACISYLRRSQEYRRANPFAWTGPAEFNHMEDSLLKYLTGERQGRAVSGP
jgi:hypothetical protein